MAIPATLKRASRGLRLPARLLACLSCAWTLGSCDTELKQATQIIVIVDAEPGVRARMAELSLIVRSENDPATADDDENVYNTTLNAADGELELPWTLAIAPQSDDASREFEVVATARDLDDEMVARVRAITSFVRGEKRALVLLLEDDCIGINCDSDETCAGGVCADAHVDPRMLPVFDQDQVTDPVVLGPPDPDGGDGDGDGDMPLPDSGRPPEDGGSDSSVPPSDASVSPGCVLNPNRQNEVCPEICPESCNGADDDCDLRIDEGSADDDCDIENAIGACDRGECTIVQCAQGFEDCDMDPVTGCESGLDDIENCGECRHACELPNMVMACIDHECEPVGCIELFEDCDMSDDSCETPLTTAENCGDCMVPCTARPNATVTCELGFCGVDECVGNFGDCNLQPNDGCEEPLDSLEYCGGCATPCDFTGSMADCSGGVCVAIGCEPDYDDCDLDTSNGCESLASAMHCGACNQTCDTTLDHVLEADCSAGTCELTCDVAGGFDNCDADPFTGCESSVRTLERCGDCTTPCSFSNAVTSCESGTCERVRCEDGFGDCDEDGADCEQGLNDHEHCGACDIDCTVTAQPFCAGGRCTSVACASGMADCDEDGVDCEINTQTDQEHCGACDNACAFTVPTPHASLQCTAGACAAACQSGYADCNRDYRDGCEVQLNSLTHCGACGMGCSIANATATCATGSCRIATCNADWADCNSDGVTCETPLNTAASCGACGAACNLGNALAVCGGTAGNRSCEIASCTQAYYSDCDETDSTGCEIDTRSSTQHCGACNNDCTEVAHVLTAHCTDSACVTDTCDPGFGNCGGGPDCETQLGTPQNCASCGNNCADLPNTATTSCSGMACAIGTCDAGFDDCDGLASTGCETNIFAPANCGGCASSNDNEACTNLPNTATTTCAGGSCAIATCANDWLNCDGVVANGCEQQLSVVGPCFPDTNCTRVVQSGRNYFFCRNDVSWPVARMRCQTQLLGDLVRVDSTAENAFIVANLSAQAWIGGSDALSEGAWLWADNGAQFWSGGPAGGGGVAVGGLFSNWAAGEPNAGGNCARIAMAGTWADEGCSGTPRDFVCEVQPDQCPADPLKTAPGQCGCGNPDTDSDGDGTANCNDNCPADPTKVAPGQCGCGNPDTDNDGDGVANCNDGCPDDGGKTSPGECGCGVADTDTDRDGVADCIDTCPYVEGTGSDYCAYPYTTSNVDSRDIRFDRAPDIIIDRCDPVIDTSDEVYFSDWCGELPTPEVHRLEDGREVTVIPLASLYIAPGRTLRVVGKRVVMLAVAGDVRIEGYIDARAFGSNGGPGAQSGCDAPGGNGGNAPSASTGAGGGGGGGFGSNGGVGGTGYRLTNPIPGGPAGREEGNVSIVPLRGGCRGGIGGHGYNGSPGGAPGDGGGGVQLSAAGLLYLSDGAAISASGGGGQGGNSAADGGGGGGSGGAVLLEGAAVIFEGNAWASANGGGGGSGVAGSGTSGNPGTDGLPVSDVRAPGGPGTGSGGGGGLGGALNGPATSGGPGGSGPLIGGAGGGGGGGGGFGRIHVRGLYECALKAGFSPEPTFECP